MKTMTTSTSTRVKARGEGRSPKVEGRRNSESVLTGWAVAGSAFTEGGFGVEMRLLRRSLAAASGHQRHLFGREQPLEGGAAARGQRLDRQFAQAALLEHHGAALIASHQQGDQSAQKRLVADQQNAFGRRLEAIEKFDQLL